MHEKKTLIQLVVALLIGLASVMGTLLLLSQETNAGPMPGEQVNLPISPQSEVIVPVQAEVQIENLAPMQADDPDMEVTKSASRDPAIAGEALTYTIIITNHGPYSGTGVVVTDTLPGGVTFVAATASQGSCNEASGVVTCTLHTMLVDDTGTVTVAVTVNPSTRGTLTNVAQVSATETDTNMVNNTYTETTAVSAPVLELTKRDYSDPVPAGAPLTYTLAYTNTGDATATNVVITDVLDSNVVYAGAFPLPTGTTPALYWNIGPLAPSTPKEIVISVTVQSGLGDGVTLVNSATIDSWETTPLSVIEETAVISHGALSSVTLAPSTAVISAGQSTSYTLTAHDAYGNDWDVTAGGSYTITHAASGSWNDNVYTSQIAGVWTVTGTCAGKNDTAALTVNPGPLDHFAFDTISGDRTAGAPFLVTITAYDAYDNLETGYAGPADLSDSTGTLYPTSTTAFTTGEWSGSVTITRTGSAVVITATDSPVSSGSNSFVVAPAALDHFAFDTSFEQTAGNSFPITITAHDIYDNLQTNYAGPADLSDSTGTLDRDSTGSFSNGEWSDSVTITRTGSAVVITATESAISDGSNTFIVQPAELHHVVLSPQASTIYAWQVQTYTVEAFDVYDNSRGDVTTQTTFGILESGHGGSWAGNIYDPSNPGDWTAQAIYTGTSVTTDVASLTVRTPVLHLDKSDDPDNDVEAGEYLTYTLTYSNTGNMTATGVVVSDTLDPNVSYVSASLPPSGGLPDAPFWAISDLAPDGLGQITVIVAVTRPLPNGTLLTNTAWVAADQPVSVSATETTTVHSSPVLTITKTDWPDPISVGGFLKYTIVITNSGNENATSTTVTETYDSNVSFLFANPDPDGGSGNRVWTFPTLVVDEPQAIEIFVQVNNGIAGGTTLTNAATLDSDQTTPISATEATYVQPKSDLQVTQMDIPDPVEAGAALIYSITYGNNGTSDATGVVITSTYDSHVRFYSASPDPDAGDNVWYIGDLDSGAGGTILVWVDVDTPLPNGSFLINTVAIDSNETAPASFITTTEISSAPIITYTITDQPDPVEAGAPLTYTLRYTNTGNANATNVVVTGTFDSFAPFFSATPAPAGGGGDVWYWELGTIDGMDNDGNVGSKEIVIQTNVTLPLTNGTTLSFTMQMKDAEGDSREEAITTTVKSAPVLSLDKSDGISTVYAGDLVTYTLAYANSGNENAYDVTITDTLPANHTQYIGCEITAGTCQHLPAEGKVVFHIPVIAAPTGGQAHVVMEVDDPLAAGARFVTNAAVMATACLSEPIEVQDVDSIGTRPDLVVNAVHAPSIFSPGKLMTYTVTYDNTGRMDAEDVTITTVLPTGTVYQGSGWSPSGGQTYTYQAGNLPAGSPVYTITFTVRHNNDSGQIGASEFNTPFTIAETRHGGEDANSGDNTAQVYIGVPDLAVISFTVEPAELQPNEPVTFTVVLENRGTGMAWNPDVPAGFWVDVFVAPVESYPFERYGELYKGAPPLAPGNTYPLTITHTGFTEQQIQNIEEFYVKVDNYAEAVYDSEGRFIGWTRLYGIVPEHDETNNLGKSGMIGNPYHFIYLPLTLRQ